MKVLKNYLSNMSNERYVYCHVILKLMKKGYSYKQAKQMFIQSDILNIMQNNHNYFFHHYPNDWVKWILKNNNQSQNWFYQILYYFKYKKL